MTTVEKESIESNLEIIKKISLESIINEINPETQIFQVSDQLNSLQLLGFHAQSIEILSSKLRFPEWVFYPNEFFHRGTVLNLAGIISQVRSAIETKELASLAASVSILIEYQMHMGWWFDYSRDVESIHNIAGKTREIENLVQLRKNELDKQSERISEIINQLNASREEFNSVVNQRNQEFNQIGLNLQTSNGDLARINDILQNSISAGERIKLFTEQENSRIEEMNAQLSGIQGFVQQYKQGFESFELDKTKRITDLDSRIEEYGNRMKSADDMLKFFKDKESYLTELTGFAAGASLFHTFKQRKLELEKPVKWWRWAVIAVSLIALGGILGIFYLSFTEMNEMVSWESIAVSAVKAIPLIILLYFVVRQYNRERIFQEEYAFKSAVALTIKAYSDLITDPKERELLISKSVSKVYQNPAIMKESPGWMVRPRAAKELKEMLEKVNETVSEIKNK